MTGERLQKILSQMGLCSRREAERLIRLGEIKINGKTAQLGDRVLVGKDHIKFKGKLIQWPEEGVETLVIALYKPKGVLPERQRNEENAARPTVYDMMPKVKSNALWPIGRLDTDSEGLLLFTNDGALKSRLSLSKYEVEKKYHVKINGIMDEKKRAHFEKSLKWEGKKLKISSLKVIRQTASKSWLEVITTENQNRTLRKVFEYLAHPVDKMRRDSFCGISLKGMVRGQYRYLKPHEISVLKKWVDLEK